MSKTVKFVASHTNTVTASASDVWAIWTDVSKWHALDSANRKAHSEAKLANGKLSTGDVINLDLHDGTTVKVVIKNVKPNEEFTDETQVPGGTVWTTHKLMESGDNLIVTYAIEADIAADAAENFRAGIWQSLIAGIPSQVENVTALARAA